MRLIPPAADNGALCLLRPKRGDIDVTYWMTAALGEEVRRRPGLTLRPVVSSAMQWVAFLDQWDPKSPWHDRRVRLAANHAIDRPTINQAENLGYSRLTNSIIPTTFDFFWLPPPPAQHDAARTKQLLAEAVVNNLQAVGIRARLRPLERASFNKGYTEKKHKNLVQTGSAAFGNAATRIEAFVAGGGNYVYGSYPDIDGLFREQAAEVDRKRREATLHRIQQLVHDKAMFAPLWQLAVMGAFGARVEEPALGLITGYTFSGPYEDVRLKGK